MDQDWDRYRYLQGVRAMADDGDGGDGGDSGGESEGGGFGGGMSESQGAMGGPGGEPGGMSESQGNMGGPGGEPSGWGEGSEMSGLGMSTMGIDPGDWADYNSLDMTGLMDALTPNMLDDLSSWLEDQTLKDFLGYAWSGIKAGFKGLGVLSDVMQGNIPGLGMKLAGWGLGQVSPSIASPLGIAKAIGTNVLTATGLIGTDEERDAIKEGANKSYAESMATPMSNERGGFDISSTPVGTELEKNEKNLDKIFSKFGEVGDFEGAVKAAKSFEAQADVRARLESEINRYSGDPDYRAIEPELRTLADAALENGNDPKYAAELAFKKVKEAYKARQFIKDFLDRKRKELEDAA